MMKWIRENIVFFIIATLCLCMLVFEIVIMIAYGDKPVGEIPTWIAWFLLK